MNIASNMDIKDSDSDVSDGWSVVDGAVQRENISDDYESNCNASDGESLELIQEGNEERKQFVEFSDVDADCFSVISNCNSMMMEDTASDNIEWTTSKLQTYVHRRNYLLNARLNFIVVIAVAAVTGLGVGHFIGSQEDCTSLPNRMPDVAIDSCDRKNFKLDFSSLYFRQPLVSHMLKAKGYLQMQRNYRSLPDSVIIEEDELRARECLLEQKSKSNNFVNKNLNDGVGVETCSAKQCEDLTGSRDVSCDACGEVEQVYDNLVYNNPLAEGTGDSLDEYSYQNSQDDAINYINSDSSAERVEVRHSEGSDHSSGGSFTPEKYQTELEFPVDRDSKHHPSEEPGKNPLDAIISHDKNMPQDLVPQEWESDIMLIKNDRVQQNGVQPTQDDEDHTEDVLPDIFVETISDYDSSVNDNDKVLSVDLDDHDCDNDIPSEQVLQQNIQKTDNHVSASYNELAPESEQQTPEQLPWLTKFSNTIQNLHGDKKLFSIVGLVSCLKQSIVELDQTIVMNESSKLLKKMQTSLTKMKDTMEGIQKEANTWSVKTADKIYHRLLKLKSKVQEKWCNLKDHYHHNHNIFGWLKNNLFQDCTKDYHSYQVESPNKKMRVDLFDENNKKNMHLIMEKGYERKQNINVVDHKGRGFNKIRHEKSEVNSHKPKPGSNVSPGNYGYARNTPDSASHDFKKTSKGAFDKLRQHSTKYHPHCNRDNRDSNHMDPAERWTLARKVAADWKNSSNTSGMWMLRLSHGRFESRKNNQKSDWLFERARARKLRRETDHDRANWYFERVQKREECRSNPQSDTCLAAKHSGQDPKKYSYDHFDDDDDDDEDEDDDKQHEYFRPKFWSKKIPSAPFAKTGKWLKNTVKEFKQKMNYYQYNQHKFHYV